MAFGQQSGPPASARQMKQLSSLLEDGGYATFREARHPLGLTQRQAGGKFTRDEATELIERLEESEAELTADDRVDRAAARLQEKQAEAAAGLPDDVLVEELGRRGWICSPPI